jgi:two-component system OmpR family sensor kinase
MMKRLGWVGVATLIIGVIAAFILRLTIPDRLMRFGFQIDPAILLLIFTLCLSLILLSVSAIFRWKTSQVANALSEQEAIQQEEQRRFIQRLDHELKNPLTAIQVQLDNLQEKVVGQESPIEEVRTQANRLTLLTRGLRRLADLETRSLEMEAVDVEELLNEVVDLLQAPDRIQLDIQRLPWAIPPIEGDRELLLLAFRNVVDNALKYSASPIQVRARHTSGHLIVEVIDTGRGIPAKEVPMVTEELYRGSNVHEINGSGLGLSMVQRIISRHRGSLELRSKEDQGTIVTIQLPYEQN